MEPDTGEPIGDGLAYFRDIATTKLWGAKKGPLEVGDKVINFKTFDQEGKEVFLEDLLIGHPTLLMGISPVNNPNTLEVIEGLKNAVTLLTENGIAIVCLVPKSTYKDFGIFSEINAHFLECKEPTRRTYMRPEYYHEENPPIFKRNTFPKYAIDQTFTVVGIKDISAKDSEFGKWAIELFNSVQLPPPAIPAVAKAKRQKADETNVAFSQDKEVEAKDSEA